MKLQHALLLCLFPFVASCDVSLYNFHVVDEGKLYRVNQLQKKEVWLEHFDKYKIKTLINLRGAKPAGKEKWFDEEVAATEEAGVKLISIKMSAQRLPHEADLEKLLDAFAEAERPILIHCQAGADRTGEASAIYSMLYMGKSKDEALKQLTPKYLHFEKKYPAKRYFVEKLWQGEQWAYEEYDPCSGEYKYYNPNNPNCS